MRFFRIDLLCFTFLDTSSKYLVLAGVSALIVAWVRFAVHVVLVGTLLRGWRQPMRFRPVNLPARFETWPMPEAPAAVDGV